MRTVEWKDETEGERRGVRVKTHHFESFSEMLDYSETRPPGCLDDGQRMSMAETGWTDMKAWTGTANMAEARGLARYGWPEGRAIVEAITAKFEGITASKMMKQQVAYAVAGDCVDMGRFVTGEPENMMIFEEKESEGAGKIVRVECTLSASAGISAAQMAIRGAAVCALVDALEQCGKSVELMLSFGTESGKRRLEVFVPIKAAGEPLDIDRLAFMLAHASMHRRIHFACKENEPEDWRNALDITGPNAGYGRPCEPTGGEYKADVRAPHMLLKSTPEACLQWVFKTLKEQGVELEGV